RRRFLAYWAAAWGCLAAGLGSLSLAFLFPALAAALLAFYCVAGYHFGFLLWAGCRHFARGQPLRPRDLALLVPPSLVGIPLADRFPDINSLFPFHAGLFTAFCVLAVMATAHCRPRGPQMAVGLRLLQGSLVVLAALFLHYSVVMGYILAYRPGLEP